MIVRPVPGKPLISIMELADGTLGHVIRPPPYYNYASSRDRVRAITVKDPNWLGKSRRYHLRETIVQWEFRTVCRYALSAELMKRRQGRTPSRTVGQSKCKGVKPIPWHMGMPSNSLLKVKSGA